MKNSKVKGLLGLLVLLFAVGLFGFFGYDTMDDIKLGLDLAGGVSITYQAVDENPTIGGNVRYHLQAAAACTELQYRGCRVPGGKRPDQH